VKFSSSPVVKSMMDTIFGFPTHAPMQRKIMQDLNSCKVFKEDPASAGRIASFCP
jgi:hypothetical protein